MKAQDATRGDVGTVEAMLDILAREAVIPIFPSYRRLLEEWHMARTAEGNEPSHRTLQMRDRLAAHFMLTETHNDDYDTIT